MLNKPVDFYILMVLLSICLYAGINYVYAYYIHYKETKDIKGTLLGIGFEMTVLFIVFTILCFLFK